jgi:hypothetical protein
MKRKPLPPSPHYMTTAEVAVALRKSEWTLRNRTGNTLHLRIARDGGVFYYRPQVERHIAVSVVRGECAGECEAVLPRIEPALLRPRELKAS